MVAQVEVVVLVDKQSARPAELLPFFEKFSVLVEDLDPIVAPIANKQPAAGIHGQGVRRIELAWGVALLAPRFNELAILRELQNTCVRIPAMAVRDKDIAIWCDQDGGRLIERVGTITGDSCLAERHQDLAVRAELENLVTLSVSPGILPVGSFSVRHPDVSFPVHMDPMRTDEHPRTKALHQLSCRIKLQNGRQVRPRAILSAASLKDPDAAPIAIDRDPGRGSYLPSLGKLEVLVDGLIGVVLGVDSLGQRNHRSAHCYCQSDSACIRHSNPPHLSIAASIEVDLRLRQL